MRYTSTLVFAYAGICGANVVTERAQVLCNGTNLLENGGFEAHPDSLKPWSNSKARVLNPGLHSKQAAGVSSRKKSTYSDLYQGFGDCSSTDNYLITWDQYLESPELGEYKSSSTIPSFGQVQTLISTTTKNNATWQSFKQSFPAPKSYRFVEYTITSTPPGTAKIDNVVVQPFPAYTVNAGATNKIKNGDFEGGSLGPWTKSSSDDLCKLRTPSINSISSGHSYGCFFHGETYSSLSQKITATPGQLYEFSFDYKIEAKGRQWYCSIEFNLGGWKYLDGIIIGGLETIIDNGRVFHYSVPFYADKAQTKVHLEFDGAYGGLKARDTDSNETETDTCRFQVDNFSFKPAHTRN